MSKVLVVFGATGQQGGSVIDFVLNDPKLSKEFKIRGLTRDPSSSSSQALQKRGVEPVKCDVDDLASVEKAIEGAHTVFANTVSIYDRGKVFEEVSQGKAIADACVAANVESLIYSTVPSPKKITKGKLSNVTLFDAKDEVKDYILSLNIKSAFFAPSSFMQNCHSHWLPRPMGPDAYGIFNVIPPLAKIPFIEIAADTGKWIGAFLLNPEEYVGKTFCAAITFYTPEDIAAALSKNTGKTVVYKQIPAEVFKGYLPEGMNTELLEMNQFIGDYGYYGTDQEELVKWSAEQAKGKLTTLEEYLERNPVKLDG